MPCPHLHYFIAVLVLVALLRSLPVYLWQSGVSTGHLVRLHAQWFATTTSLEKQGFLVRGPRRVSLKGLCMPGGRTVDSLLQGCSWRLRSPCWRPPLAPRGAPPQRARPPALLPPSRAPVESSGVTLAQDTRCSCGKNALSENFNVLVQHSMGGFDMPPSYLMHHR